MYNVKILKKGNSVRLELRLENGEFQSSYSVATKNKGFCLANKRKFLKLQDTISFLSIESEV